MQTLSHSLALMLYIACAVASPWAFMREEGRAERIARATALMESKETISVKVQSSNAGGVLVSGSGVIGKFLPGFLGRNTQFLGADMAVMQALVGSGLM